MWISQPSVSPARNPPKEGPTTTWFRSTHRAEMSYYFLWPPTYGRNCGDDDAVEVVVAEWLEVLDEESPPRDAVTTYMVFKHCIICLCMLLRETLCDLCLRLIFLVYSFFSRLLIVCYSTWNASYYCCWWWWCDITSSSMQLEPTSAVYYAHNVSVYEIIHLCMCIPWSTPVILPADQQQSPVLRIRQVCRLSWESQS